MTPRFKVKQRSTDYKKEREDQEEEKETMTRACGPRSA